MNYLGIVVGSFAASFGLAEIYNVARSRPTTWGATWKPFLVMFPVSLAIGFFALWGGQ